MIDLHASREERAKECKREREREKEHNGNLSQFPGWLKTADTHEYIFTSTKRYIHVSVQFPSFDSGVVDINAGNKRQLHWRPLHHMAVCVSVAQNRKSWKSSRSRST